MTKRIVLLATLILSLVLLPGCPGGVSALVGSWVITSGVSDYGIQLNANGEGVPYFIDGLILGTLTWEIDGTRVIWHQVNGAERIVWVARLTSETTMSGTWANWEGNSYGSSNTWSAVKQ